MRFVALRFNPNTGEILSKRDSTYNPRIETQPLWDDPNKLVAGVDFPEELLTEQLDIYYEVDFLTRTLRKSLLADCEKRCGIPPSRKGKESKKAEIAAKHNSLPARPKPREDR